MDIKELKYNSFPELLKEITGAPERIFLRGKLPSDSLVIAIVGTRKATNSGIKIAESISQELASVGITIVSGLAMGIDAGAHRGAIRNGGKTVAVLGCGIDRIYPAQNLNLAKQILENGGGIISEYPPRMPSYKNQFIERNRIISGLAQAVVVVEAPVRSGALATAGFAALQGREVFVVPGPVNHPNYEGSHALIRDGARLVTSAEDIVGDLGIETAILSNRTTEKGIKLDDRSGVILDKIKEQGEPVGVDKILELTKLEPQAVNQALALLVLQGFIKETEGGYTI